MSVPVWWVLVVMGREILNTCTIRYNEIQPRNQLKYDSPSLIMVAVRVGLSLLSSSGPGGDSSLPCLASSGVTLVSLSVLMSASVLFTDMCCVEYFWGW